MSLKDLIREVHGPSEVIPALDVFLMQMKDDPRRDGWHPSDFCGMCPRERVLKKLVNWPEDEFKIGAKLRRIFDLGTALHECYQEKYFGPMGILWGKWMCHTCKAEHWGFMPGKQECYSDAFCHWIFHEVPFEAKIVGCKKKVFGHSDGLLKLADKWAVLEIKSINDWGFGRLTEPKEKHEKQGQIYGELAKQGCVPAPEGIKVPKPEDLIIWYINKNNCDQKEFHIPLDSEVGKAELMKPRLHDEAFVKKELPPRWDQCKNMLKKPAKDCEVGSYCFGGMTWNQLQEAGR